MPGLPILPFVVAGRRHGRRSATSSRCASSARGGRARQQEASEGSRRKDDEEKNSVKESLTTAEIELVLGKQLSAKLLASHQELAFRMAQDAQEIRHASTASWCPEVKLTDDFAIPPKTYQIKIHGTVVAEYPAARRRTDGAARRRDAAGHSRRRSARAGLRHARLSVPEMFAEDLKRERLRLRRQHVGLLTHLSEVIRNNLPQLLSYKDMKALLDRQDPEYRKLADEICTTHISYPGLQAVLKLLLAERVSIRNLHLIIEAIAEIAPHVRRTEQIVEHVRIRMAQQICGDLTEGGVLKVLRLGNRWDLAFHQSLKRDAKGEIVEFDIDPRLLEEFGQEATKAIRGHTRHRRAIRHRHGARRAPLRAHDHRAAVPDPAGAVPCRNRQGRRDRAAGNDSS